MHKLRNVPPSTHKTHTPPPQEPLLPESLAFDSGPFKLIALKNKQTNKYEVDHWEPLVQKVAEYVGSMVLREGEFFSDKAKQYLSIYLMVVEQTHLPYGKGTKEEGLGSHNSL